jgi:hypothetical protein
MVLQAAILAVLRRRDGSAVVGDGPRWRLKETGNEAAYSIVSASAKATSNKVVEE